MRCQVEQMKASEVRQGDHAAFLDTPSPSPELGTKQPLPCGPQVGGHGEVI